MARGTKKPPRPPRGPPGTTRLGGDFARGFVRARGVASCRSSGSVSEHETAMAFHHGGSECSTASTRSRSPSSIPTRPSPRSRGDASSSSGNASGVVGVRFLAAGADFGRRGGASGAHPGASAIAAERTRRSAALRTAAAAPRWATRERFSSPAGVGRDAIGPSRVAIDAAGGVRREAGEDSSGTRATRDRGVGASAPAKCARRAEARADRGRGAPPRKQKKKRFDSRHHEPPTHR